MKLRIPTCRALGTLALLLALAAAPVTAQLQTGNLYGRVTDNEGSALPGATVTLTGDQAPQIQVTNANGRTRPTTARHRQVFGG